MLYACMYICMSVSVYVYVRLYMNESVRACMQANGKRHTHTDIHTHTHAHIHCGDAGGAAHEQDVDVARGRGDGEREVHEGVKCGGLPPALAAAHKASVLPLEEVVYRAVVARLQEETQVETWLGKS